DGDLTISVPCGTSGHLLRSGPRSRMLDRSLGNDDASRSGCISVLSQFLLRLGIGVLDLYSRVELRQRLELQERALRLFPGVWIHAKIVFLRAILQVIVDLDFRTDRIPYDPHRSAGTQRSKTLLGIRQNTRILVEPRIASGEERFATLREIL